MNAQVSVRILLGVGDTESVRWDGTIAAQGGKIASLAPWRFEGADAIVGLDLAFEYASGPAVQRGNAGLFARREQRRRQRSDCESDPKAGGGAELKVTTAQGDFTVALDELAYGKPVPKLNGRVAVDRIPSSVQLTNTPDEEDYPSAATGKNGDVWLAYVVFHHNPDHNSLRAALETTPKDFSKWKSPTGGDQIFARKYSGGAWGKPIAITAGGGDLYRTAIAVDGQGRPWVFWAQNVKAGSGRANFEIFARAIQNDAPGAAVQISNDPGSDIDPVAATDRAATSGSRGRAGATGRPRSSPPRKAATSSARQPAVSQSSGNEWNPAIAADNSGRVTVAWDSYRNENYDVYVRTASSGTWGPETPVAASARYEAYPSVAYDGGGRLWVAYEEGGKGWGKDFGAYNTNGVAVYQGRAIRLRGFEPDGRAVEAAGDLGAVLPGMPNIHIEKAGMQNDFEKLDPDAKNAQTREAGPVRAQHAERQEHAAAPGGRWSGPHLAGLPQRASHLVECARHGLDRTLVSFDGKAWSSPIYLNHSDNLLDNRPALVSTRAGQLLVLGSSDNRRQYLSRREYQLAAGHRGELQDRSLQQRSVRERDRSWARHRSRRP